MPFVTNANVLEQFAVALKRQKLNFGAALLI